MATASSNNRASLLAGLRTGGVRSSSATVPHTAAPSQAIFSVNRFPSHPLNSNATVFPDEFDDGQAAEIPTNLFATSRGVPMTAAVDGNHRFAHQQQQPFRGTNNSTLPFGPAYANNLMTQQQQQNLQVQAIQLQIQLEMMRMQAQAQQNYQAELTVQTQRQQNQPLRRASFNPPATAGPVSNSFDLRTATLSAQMRRANQAHLAAAVSGSEDTVPMTAALGGKFGSRSVSSPMARFNVTQGSDEDTPASLPPTPNSTTVISGGTCLGSLASNNLHSPQGAPSFKSDSVSSWRRGSSKGNSVLSGLRSVTSSPSVKVTPPPPEKDTPLPGLSTGNAMPSSGPPLAKARPRPLRFSPAVSQPLPAVTIDRSDVEGDLVPENGVTIITGTEIDNDDGYSSSSSSNKSKSSSPTTPSSNEMTTMMMTMAPPLSPREEASKKLYEGLGIGRPRSAVADASNSVPSATHNLPTKTSTSVTTTTTTTLNPHSPPFNPAAAPFTPYAKFTNNTGAGLSNSTVSSEVQLPSLQQPNAASGLLVSSSVSGSLLALHRMVSQPLRQPRGPPSGTDELGPKNFATRIRRKATDGLGSLLHARERRELVEVY